MKLQIFNCYSNNEFQRDFGDLTFPYFQYHPDVTGSVDESSLTKRFIAIKEAYDVLKDADNRNEYDAYRAQTSCDYSRQTYSTKSGYNTWKSNHYAGNYQYRSSCRYDEAHLRKVETS